MIRDDELKKIYIIFKNIFIISTIPSLIVLLLFAIGFDSVIPSRYFGESYRPFIIYPGTLIQPSQIIFVGGIKFSRITGIFIEPGALGLITLFLLIAENMNLKSKKNRIILAIGILTFSLAFYILITLYFMFILISSKNYKTAASTIVIFLLMAFLIQKTEIFNSLILSRIAESDIEDEQIGNYKRTFVSTKDYFDYFFTQSTKKVMIGNGIGANREEGAYYGAEGHNYMAFLYNHGLLSAILILFVLFKLLNYRHHGIIGILILVLIIANMYQRPYIFNSGLIFMLYMTSFNLKYLKRKGELFITN
jgi:hypothetical protein